MTYQVVSQQLHDQGGVLVAFLTEGVEFGDSIIKCLFGKMAGLIRGVQDLIVEDREVESETETDGVSGSKVGLSDFGCSLVRLKRLIRGFLALVGSSELSEVAVVVTLPETILEEFEEGVGRLTSCDRRLWIHQSEQRQSSACRELRGYLHRSFQAPSRLSRGTL